MIISVIKAEYIDNYSIMLDFNNGKKGLVDLKDTIFKDKRRIFEALQDVDFFKNFSLGSWTINWKNNLDL